MWSFYTLAVMLSAVFFMSISMFGSTKVTKVTSNVQAGTVPFLLVYLFVWWNFLSPLTTPIGGYVFSLIALLVFINFVRGLGRTEYRTYYGYQKFFLVVFYIVGLILYQVIYK